MASSKGLGIAPYLFFFGGLVGLYIGLSTYLLLQKIKNTPTSKVQSAAVGLVELSGTAESREPAISPISKVPSAYYLVESQYYVKSRRSGHWHTFHTSLCKKPFYLKDETGKMLIDPTGVDVNIPPDNTFQGNMSGKKLFGLMDAKKLPVQVLDYINTLNSEDKQKFDGMQDRNLRIIERYLANGDPLYVLGTAEPVEGASSAIGSENLVVKKGKFDKVMIIADSGEKKILDSWGKTMFWSLLLGFIFSVIGLIMILMSLKIG